MKPYKVRIAKKISSAIALVFLGLMGYAIYVGSQPVIVPSTPEPVVVAAPVCELDCLVDNRAEKIHDRDQAEYRKQSHIKALIEIQDELHAITLNLNN
jgi:hypothetical protein